MNASWKRPLAVLFDLDGTLIDSAPDLGSAANTMRVARGLPELPLDDYRPFASSGARGMLHIAFGITPEHPDFLAMREEYLNRYEACMTEKTHAFEGVGLLLQSLHSHGVAWGVITNKITRFAKPLTEAMPLFDASKVLICGDTTAHSKPHPAPMFEAAKRLNLAPEQCWYVGDDKRDIEAGQAAGMRSLAATWGYMGEQHWSAWGADAVLESPQQLQAMLDQAGA